MAAAPLIADLIYIDAAHHFGSVKLDLQKFWPLLSRTGVLFGDDYGVWPGVTKAVNEFIGHLEKPLYTASGKFVMSKRRNTRLKTGLSTACR